MPAPKPPCVTIRTWLQNNLGKTCLAALTGTDAKALAAAVQIAELWTYADNRREVAQAFGLVVRSMQPSVHHLAYHAIAHVADWSYRQELWLAAGMGAPNGFGLCAYEPGGTERR